MDGTSTKRKQRPAAAGCALFCAAMSFVGVTFLGLLGVLSLNRSRRLEISPDHADDAAYGCFGAAAFYAVTFLGSTLYLHGAGHLGYVLRADVQTQLVFEKSVREKHPTDACIEMVSSDVSQNRASSTSEMEVVSGKTIRRCPIGGEIQMEDLSAPLLRGSLEEE